MPIPITKYMAIDNIVFDTEQEAIEHEKSLTETPHEQLMRFFHEHKEDTVRLFDMNSFHFSDYSLIYIERDEVFLLATLLYRVNVLDNKNSKHISWEEYAKEVPVANYYIWHEVDKNNIIIRPVQTVIRDLSMGIDDLIKGVRI